MNELQELRNKVKQYEAEKSSGKQIEKKRY
jgi:hypothetical protein